MKKNILYSNFQRNLHFTLLLRSLLSILLLFNSVLHTEIITIVNDLFFLFFIHYGNVKLKRTLIIIIPSLSVASCLSVAVSLIIVLCFFSNVGIWFFFFFVVRSIWTCSKRNRK